MPHPLHIQSLLGSFKEFFLVFSFWRCQNFDNMLKCMRSNSQRKKWKIDKWLFCCNRTEEPYPFNLIKKNVTIFFSSIATQMAIDLVRWYHFRCNFLSLEYYMSKSTIFLCCSNRTLFDSFITLPSPPQIVRILLSLSRFFVEYTGKIFNKCK